MGTSAFFHGLDGRALLTLAFGSNFIINTETIMTSLFDPLALGPITLPNRLIMAPMTRSRADADGEPTELMVTNYAQRARAGL